MGAIGGPWRPWLAVLAFVVFAGCTAYPPPIEVLVHEEHLVLYAVGTGGNVALSIQPPSGAGDAVTVAGADAPEGLQAALKSQAGQKTSGVSVSFNIPKGLDRTLFLNLSARIHGALNVSSTINGAATQGEAMKLKIEAFSGATRLGGTEFASDSTMASGAWASVSFAFPAEQPRVPAGEAMTLKVTRLTGTSQFLVGTGSAHPSVIEFHYFAEDPLANGAYLEDGVLYTSQSKPASESERADAAHDYALLNRPAPGSVVVLPRQEDSRGSTAAPILIGLAAATLLGLGGPRRRVVLVLLILVAGALAGCLGGARAPGNLQTSSGDGPRSTSEQSLEDNKSLAEKGFGALRGLVLDGDRGGVPLEGAHAALLGTSRSVRTDKAGTFFLDRLPPKAYVLRVDREGLEPIEQPVTVLVGKILSLNITLFAPEVSAPGLKPHGHGEWGEETKLLIQKIDSFVPTTFVRGYAGQRQGDQWACAVGLAIYCESKVAIDPAKPVPVGTGMLEVVVKWQTAPQFGLNEVSLRLTDAFDPEDGDFGEDTINGYVLGERPSGDPFRLAIYPNHADPGHQKFTSWSFFLRTARTSALALNPADQQIITGGPFNIEIWAHKGVVPFEPAHRDLWKGRPQIDLFKEVSKGPGGTYTEYPTEDSILWVPGPDGWVPPGSLEIRGSLSWTLSTAGAALPSTRWTVAYKSAKIPAAEWSQDRLKRPDTETRSGNKVDFVIKVDAADVDQFYQYTPYWIFYLDDQQAPVAPGRPETLHNGYQTNWKLSATVFKDPNYAEE